MRDKLGYCCALKILKCLPLNPINHYCLYGSQVSATNLATNKIILTSKYPSIIILSDPDQVEQRALRVPCTISVITTDYNYKVLNLYY